MDNTLSIWNYWHLISTQSKPSTPPADLKTTSVPFKRSNSLPTRFRHSVIKRSTNPLRDTSSHPVSTEVKKSNGEQLHRMMKEYLEKVRSLCVSSRSISRLLVKMNLMFLSIGKTPKYKT